MNTEIVSAVVLRLMERTGIKTPTELAAKAGVLQPTLSRLFTGKHEAVKVETLQAIALYFKVTVSHLLGEIPLDPDPGLDRVINAYNTTDARGKSAILFVAEKESTFGPASNG